MPMTRQQIEAVLKEYGVEVPCKLKDCGGTYGSDTAHGKMLVDALLALAPTPSREALEKIIEKWDIDLSGAPEAIIKEFMAWVSGQPPEPRWCDDISYRAGRWEMNYEPPLRVNPHWKLCPICAAPRPARS